MRQIQVIDRARILQPLPHFLAHPLQSRVLQRMVLPQSLAFHVLNPSDSGTAAAFSADRARHDAGPPPLFPKLQSRAKDDAASGPEIGRLPFSAGPESVPAPRAEQAAGESSCEAGVEALAEPASSPSHAKAGSATRSHTGAGPVSAWLTVLAAAEQGAGVLMPKLPPTPGGVPASTEVRDSCGSDARRVGGSSTHGELAAPSDGAVAPARAAALLPTVSPAAQQVVVVETTQAAPRSPASAANANAASRGSGSESGAIAPLPSSSIVAFGAGIGH